MLTMYAYPTHLSFYLCNFRDDTFFGSILVGRQMDDIAAGTFVLFQLQQTAALPFFQQLAEGLKPVIGFVEAGLAPLQGLLDH